MTIVLDIIDLYEILFNYSFVNSSFLDGHVETGHLKIVCLQVTGRM